MEKISWTDHVKNEEVLLRVKEHRKVAGSIPGGVIGIFFIVIKSFRPHYGTGVDSAPNRNECQEQVAGA